MRKGYGEREGGRESASNRERESMACEMRGWRKRRRNHHQVFDVTTEAHSRAQKHRI